MSNNKYLHGIKIFNAIGFQIGWFVCVSTINLVGLSFAITFIIIHLILLRCYSNKFLFVKEVSWIFTILTIGFLIETLFFSMGVLYKDIQTPYLTYLITPPFWILYLWLLFATSLRTSLSFLFNKPWVAYLTTAIMAPCSYFVGANLNTHVDINDPLALSIAIISVVWVFALWVITHIKHFYFEDIFYDS